MSGETQKNSSFVEDALLERCIELLNLCENLKIKSFFKEPRMSDKEEFSRNALKANQTQEAERLPAEIADINSRDNKGLSSLPWYPRSHNIGPSNIGSLS